MNIDENRFELSEKPQARYGSESVGLGMDGSNIRSEQAEHRFLKRVLSAWHKILLTGAIAGATALIAYSGYRYLSPLPVTYSNAIVVTMAEVEKGIYPNGAAYSATDLRSAPVLEAVYHANGIDKYGVSLSTFQGYVSVESYSPSYSFLVDRYRERLSNKTLTFDEKKSIEDEFKSAESSLKASGLVVNMTLPENTPIPATVARKTVVDIPAKWAEIFVGRLGVANLPLLASGTNLVDEKLASELDYPLAYDYLDGQAESLRSSINDALSVPGASTFLSEETGKSLADLSREFRSVYRYRIQLGLKPLIDKGLSKDPLTTSLIYENAIANIDRDANAQTGYADSIQTILESFRTNASSGSPAVPGGVSPVTTQIDGAFVDKIVELTSKGEGLEFEKELQKEKLQRQNDKVSLAEQKSRYADRLAAIQSGQAQGAIRPGLEKKFVEGFANAINDLNQLWKETFVIASELGVSKLNSDKSLYRVSELPNSRKTVNPPLLEKLAILFAMALTLAAMILAGLYFALRPEIERMKKPGRNA
jgi:hypothetical protein